MGISVIVPVYNKVGHIKRCLDSIHNQEYDDFEVIVIDDGSNDGSEKTIEEFSKYENFHIVHTENGGVSSARNIGIQLAKKSHLVFIDSDDFLSKNFFLKLDLERNNDDEVTVISGFSVGEKKYIPQARIFSHNEIINNYADLSFFLNTPYAKLFNTHVIKVNNLFFDEEMNYGEDLEFNLRYLRYAKTIKVISCADYTVVETDGGLSRSAVPLMLKYQLKVIDTALRLYGNDRETVEGNQQIIIKAIKTVLNYDMKNENIKTFYFHVSVLSEVLKDMSYIKSETYSARNFQDFLIFYLTRNNFKFLLFLMFLSKKTHA